MFFKLYCFDMKQFLCGTKDYFRRIISATHHALRNVLHAVQIRRKYGICGILFENILRESIWFVGRIIYVTTVHNWYLNAIEMF